MTTRSPLAAYGVALAAVVTAVILRLLMDPLLGSGVPFITLFVAVTFAAWYGGLGPGLVALVVGGVCAAVLLVSPRQGVTEYVGGLVVYCLVAFAMVQMLELLRNASRRSSEDGELLRTTLRCIGEGVITAGTDARVQTMNPVAESLTGWTREQAFGQRLDIVFRILDEQTLTEVDHPGTRSLQDGAVVTLAHDCILLAKNGVDVPIAVTAAPIRVEQHAATVGVVLVFRDETARRVQMRQLASHERRFRTLAESIPQLVWMARPTGDIFWYNQRWYEYTGTTFEEMEGWGWQSVHDPKVLPKVLERWRASIASGEPFEMVFPIKAADGVFRAFLTRVVPIRNDDGEVVQWFGTNTDISDQPAPTATTD